MFEELDLIARINQDDDGQLLKIVEGEDKGYTRTNLQHVDEMASLHKNEAWDLVKLLAGKKPIGRKMGVQKEDKCKRKSGEIQSLVGSKRLFPSVEN